MSLLYDQNLSIKLVTILQVAFPYSAHIKQFDMATDNDNEIWEFAKRNNYTIVTKDTDFYHLNTFLGYPPKIIILKCGNKSTAYIANLMLEFQEVIKESLNNPAIGYIELY